MCAYIYIFSYTLTEACTQYKYGRGNLCKQRQISFKFKLPTGLKGIVP